MKSPGRNKYDKDEYDQYKVFIEGLPVGKDHGITEASAIRDRLIYGIVKSEAGKIDHQGEQYPAKRLYPEVEQ